MGRWLDPQREVIIMKRPCYVVTISFMIEGYDLAYYETDAKAYLKEAIEYGYNSNEFIFHIEPCGKDLYKVTIGGINCDINIRDTYVDISWGNIEYTIYFNNMVA